MRLFNRLFLPIFVLILLLSVQPALAHGYIVRAIPEDRVTLEHPPARLQYWFSEALEPGFSTVTLRDQTGAVLAEGGVDADNGALMSLPVPADLPDGAYIVDLRPAFASDGHVVAETRVFFVGEEVGGVTGSQSGYEVIPLEVLWRSLLYASTLVLFGGFTLYAYVLLPAWGNPDYRAGLLPPRVMRRLNWIVGAALALALAGNSIAILQQSMVFFNTDISQVLAQGLWQVVRIGSRFGDVWTARMILLALAGALWGLSVYWRDERPDMVRAFWTANVWVGALLLGAFSITSHAAGSLIAPWLAMFVDWLHTLAVGAWVGGLVALTVVLPVALRPYQGDDRRVALLAVLWRFSWLAVRMLVIVVATGIYSAFNWLYQPSDLTQTDWGLSLLVKLALVGGVLLLALGHHVTANPERYQRWLSIAQRTGITSLRLEVVLALVVLVSVANLSATAVPEPVFLTESIRVPQASQTIGDYTVALTISPGGPGVNTFDTIISRDGQALTDAQVNVQLVEPARDWRGNWQEAQPVGSGLYVYAGGEIDEAGRWLTLLDIEPADGDGLRAAFDWDISREAAVPQSLPLGSLNMLALVGVLGAVVWVLYPSFRRLVRWLDWRPSSVAAGAAAIIVTTAAIVLAVALVIQSEADYNATINPPPVVVNNILPDSQSLAQGQALYIEHCIDWQAHPADFNALKNRLPQTRDEELFFATRDGWRGLPACSGDLTDEQRWHIVNFFRTLA